MRVVRRLFIACLALAALSSAGAQTPDQTFKSGVTVIQVPVVVRDRDGQTVGNLGKDDFQLFDNGKRQEIASFSVESAGGQSAPDRSLPAAGATVTAGTAVAIPTRFVAYFFDDLTIRDLGDRKRLHDAFDKQLAALQPGDRAGIFTSSCEVQIDFTADRQKLQEGAARLALLPTALCRVSRSQTLQVELMKAVVKRMAALPARRDIVLVSSGFFIGHDRTTEEADFIEAAIHAKVAINVIDTGETTDRTGMSGADGGGQGYQRYGSGNPSNPVLLVDLARGTGGRYTAGNDFAINFRKLSTPESHYVLGFVPTGKQDGRFHQLKVKLGKPGKLSVDARNGYYATPQSE